MPTAARWLSGGGQHGTRVGGQGGWDVRGRIAHLSWSPNQGRARSQVAQYVEALFEVLADAVKYPRSRTSPAVVAGELFESGAACLEYRMFCELLAGVASSTWPGSPLRRGPCRAAPA